MPPASSPEAAVSGANPRRGISLLELILAITILATAATIGIRRTADNHDRHRRQADRVAVDAVVTHLRAARRAAVVQGAPVEVTASRRNGRWLLQIDASAGHDETASRQTHWVGDRLALVGGLPPIRFDGSGGLAAPVRWQIRSTAVADTGRRDLYTVSVSPVSGSVRVETP